MMKQTKLYITFDLLKNACQYHLGSMKDREFLFSISMKGSEFLFDYVDLLHYHCHKINPSCSESYKDSPDWIKKDNSKFHR